MEDNFIGGWTMPAGPTYPSPHPTQQPYTNGDGSTQMNTALPPPRLSPHLQQTGYPFIRPPSGSVSPALQGGVRQSTDESPLAQLGPVERSQNLNLRKRIMQPYLQFMCGPLLRYDAVDQNGVWHGAALIVSKCCSILPWLLSWRALRPSPATVIWKTSSVAADAGSTYEPYPSLKYRWDPKRSTPYYRRYSAQSARGVDLGPHPADPMAVHIGSQPLDGHIEGPNVIEQKVLGRDIYVYSGRGGWVLFVLACTSP